MEAVQIPNLKVVNIATKGRPLNMIKGFVELPCWNGHFLAEKPNHVTKTTTVTNGWVELWVDGEILEDGAIKLMPEQVEAYNYLIEHQQSIRQSIIAKLRTDFPKLLEEDYESWDHEESFFPNSAELNREDFDFKNYLGPESIQITEEVKDGVAYLQWRFLCLWDIEHGLEVITHNERVIEIAPEADPFKINADNGTLEEVEKEYKNKVWKLPQPPKKKKWWHFW